MKVICRNCGGLIPEDQAVKMSLVEFKQWEMIKKEINFISYGQHEHNIYIQLCEDCYKGKK